MSKFDLKYQTEHKLRVAGEFESEGKLLHAVQLYKSVIEENHDLLEAWFRLAELYLKLDKLNSAVLLLTRLVDSNADDIKLRLLVSQFLLRCEQWEKVLEVLNSLSSEDDPLVSFFLGYANYNLQDYEVSRVHFLSFLGYSGPTELKHEANLFLARIEVHACDYEAALNYAKRTDVVYSNYWELNQLYAIIYYNIGMEAHAGTYINKAMKLNSKEASNYKWAGKIYARQGDYKKSEGFFLKYIELNENATSTDYMNLADSCLKGNNLKDAALYYEVVLKLDPDNQAALMGREKTLTLLKKTESK